MPAILSRGLLPAVRRADVICVRLFASAHAASPHGQTTKQLQYDTSEGFLKYDRDVSRDGSTPNPQKPGDTPRRLLLRRLGHAYEIYPIIALCGAWAMMFCYIVWFSFTKIEVWLDRSQELPPWDWERIRDKYWKMPTLTFDYKGVSHRRLPLMEKLQDEMVEAAKKRGTR